MDRCCRRSSEEIAVVVDTVNNAEPLKSNWRIASKMPRRGPCKPISSGITTADMAMHRSSGGTWMPNSHRQPSASAMAPPRAAPRAEPAPKFMVT